jgi:hypothetical protein
MESIGVWIFVGDGARFPSGAFSSRDNAERWIQTHNLSGTLRLYPLDEGVYEWAIRKGAFKSERPQDETPEFIGRFSSAIQDHFHYRTGAEETDHKDD